MTYKKRIEIKKARNKKHFFARIICSGRITWRTSEIYASKRAVKNAIGLLDSSLPVIDLTKKVKVKLLNIRAK